MSRNRLLNLAVAVGLVLTSAVFAQEQRRPQTFTERYGQQLNLTDAQKKTIDDLDAKFQKDNAEFLDSFQKLMAQVRDARQANDQAKLDELKPKVDAARAQMTKLRTDLEDKIAANFTDEQKAAWAKIKEEREARMKERQHQ